MNQPASPPAQPPAGVSPAVEPRRVRVAGQELRVYAEWPALRDDILADIAAATTRIWVEVYIFYNDNGGKRVAEALKAKARQGLDVRVMYDAVGCQSTPEAFFTDLQDAGVRVHCVHSFWEALENLAFSTILNRRDHRKLIVIDERVGYFGGMNLIDNTPESTGAATQEETVKALPTSAGWRDVHLRIEGAKVLELADSFERAWHKARHKHLPRHLRRSLKARQALARAHRHQEAAPESIRFLDSYPRFPFSAAARAYATLLRRARRHVCLSMAYFVPVDGPMRALLRARRRGVRIRVIVPGVSDVKLVQRATAYLYDKLLQRGFRLYERQDRMLHAKAMVVDDQWTLVGSANLDPRSLFTNWEFLAIIRSPALAAAILDLCRDEIRASRRITPAVCRQRSWLQRLRNTLAWSLRWWL